MLDLNHRIDEIRVLDYLFVMRHHFILLALFVTLLAASSCCDQRSTASAIKRDYLISVINSNLDLPIVGFVLAKQSYHVLSLDDRERVKAVIELQTKNERNDVRAAALQTLADLRALDKVL